MHFYFFFSECAVMSYSVHQPPDNAAEIIACVTDVDPEIAIPLVQGGLRLSYEPVHVSEIWDPCHSLRVDPDLADQP